MPPLCVAPRVGAWIEIYAYNKAGRKGIGVAPRVGAWIEMRKAKWYIDYLLRRTPCGCVD